MKECTSAVISACTLFLTVGLGCGKKETNTVGGREYGTEKVINEQFIVAFSEGGQLEAVESLRVESEMDGSSTIVYVVDEGSTVRGPREIQAKTGDTPEGLADKHEVSEEALRHVNPDLERAIAEGQTVIIPGDLLVELDPGSLKDKILSQEIAVRSAKNSLTKSSNDLEIQRLKNEQSIETAKIEVTFAKLALDKFKNSDSQLQRDDFMGSITNLSNQVQASQEQMAISESKIKWYRELEAKKFLSNMALREEELKLFSEKNKVTDNLHKIRMLRGNSDAYEKYEYPKLEQDYQSKIKEAELSLTTVQQTATNNMITATEEVNTAKQKLSLEEEKLVEVKDQMKKSKIYAPGSGLVVYHVAESSRYGGSSQPIEKGSTLRKGQDIINLPDLSQMQVALKIHESRINQVKPGLFVQVRIDTVPDRAFKGEISYVAPVASAAERWGSNKKVFKCQVSITEKLPEYVRPGASATCRIYVANLPKVRELADGTKAKTLKVPIQSVVTTSEGRRVCFKMVEGAPSPVPVDTGYYDQTHIQVTKGLVEGDTILKAPLLFAKELNVGGGLFGYRQVNPEDLNVQLPVSKAAPGKASSTKRPLVQVPTKRPPTQTPTKGGSGSGRPSGGGFGRSSGPPEELKLTDDQKAKWTAASDQMRSKMREMFTSGVPREEMGAKMAEIRNEFQTKVDGFLTADQKKKYQEIQSQSSQGTGGRPGGGSGGGGRQSMIGRYDTDGDGKVSEEEYGSISDRARQFMGEFSGLDTNADGFIDKDEEAAFTRKLMERFQGGGGRQ